MPGQLAFDFAETGERAVGNVYFAVLPNENAAREMKEVGHQLRHWHKLPGWVQPAPLLHISLAHVGRFAGVPERMVATSRMAGSAVRCAPFDASFDRARSFDNRDRSSVVLRCGRGDEGFAQLRRAIAGAMLGAGLRADLSVGLTPHVTLVYNGRHIPETTLSKPIAWTVREFVLVRSLYGQGRHVYLGRWPLG